MVMIERPRFNLKSDRADLLLHYEPPRALVERKRGGPDYESHPLKLDIDNRAFFDSLGLKSLSLQRDELIAKSRKAALESAAQYTREGNMLAEPKSYGAIARIAVLRTQKTIESVLAFIPDPPEFHWSGGEVETGYIPDELSFNWDTGGVEKNYVPHSTGIYLTR